MQIADDQRRLGEGASRTYALLIGISKYRDLEHLETASRDANALADTLKDERGCNIPNCHVKSLIEADATLPAVLHAIADIVLRAREQDIIFIYFAGHGKPLANDFALCTWDSDSLNLIDTAVLGSAIADRLSKTRARGVLLVIDCCYGAHFAERAPDFFRAPGSADYRILISATRATQRSWEHPDGKGTLFSRHLRSVLDGSIPVGAIPGAIFFSDLMRFVARKVEEDLRHRDPQLVQEPLFIGTYVRDPLLFLQARLTGRKILLLLARYSLRDMLRFAAGTAVTFVAILATIFLLHYSLLERSQYAFTGARHIEILQGWPGLNWYGFPKLVWETDFAATDARDDSPLRSGERALTATPEAPIKRVLLGALRPENQIRAAIWDGKIEEARKRMRSLFEGKAFRTSLDPFAPFFPQLAEAADVNILEQVTTDAARPETRAYAVIALTRLRPDGAGSGMQRLRRDTWWLPKRVLVSLEGACDLPTRLHITGILRSPNTQDYRSAALDTALRLHCTLGATDLIPSLMFGFGTLAVPDVAGYIDVVSSAAEALPLIKEFALADPQVSGLPKQALLIIALASKAGCDLAVLKHAKNPDPDIRAAVAAAVLAHCRGENIDQAIAAISPSPQVTAVFAAHKKNPRENVLHQLAQPGLDPFDAAFLLFALGQVGTRDDVPRILQLVSERPPGEQIVQLAAVMALRALGAPGTTAERFLVYSGSEIERASLEWLSEADPPAAIKLMRHRLMRGEAPVLANFIGQLNFSSDDVLFLRGLLKSDAAWSAAALLAQFCSSDELERLLSDRKERVRSGALAYAIVNPATDDALADRVRSSFPSRVYLQLKHDIRMRKMIRSELDRVPQKHHAWRARLIRSGWEQQLSPGVSLLLARAERMAPINAFWNLRSHLL